MKTEQAVDLLDVYRKVIAGAIDSEGVFPHQLLYLDSQGELKIEALLLRDPHAVLRRVRAVLAEKAPRKLIFALDRFTKPDQGTTLSDCLAGAYYDGELWRPFVLEYQHEPRIIKPIAWDNAFWNRAVMFDLKYVTGRV